MPKRGHGPRMPVQQLAILAVARFAEPLALTSVFPYLPEMMGSFGVVEDEIPKWAGFTGAIFSVSQSMTAVPWGRAADSWGRKPTILLGLFSTMVCFVFWGMSTSLPMAITVRAIMGGGNGNVGIIRTMVAEMVTDKELQPKAFSIMPLVWSIGSVFGPAFGGFFARPAKQFPGLFGNSEFFKKYPFALPNLVACVVFFISLTTGLLFLKETLESKRHSRDWGLVLGEKLTQPFNRTKRTAGKQHRLSFVDDESQAPLLNHNTARTVAAVEPPPTMREIFSRQVVINLVSYTFLALHSVAYDQILPVFLHYPVRVPDATNTHLPFQFSGGFGLNSDKIGTIFTLQSFVCGFIQFLVFPPLCARFGVLNCFRIATMLFPVVYLLTPYTVLIEDVRARYAAFFALMLLKGFMGIVGFPSTTILLTNSAPSLRILGTLNGFATTFSGIGRAVGPAATGAIFTWGVERGYIIAPWWLLAIIAAMGAVPSWFIVEGKGPHQGLVSDDDDEDDGEEAVEGEEEILLPNNVEDGEVDADAQEGLDEREEELEEEEHRVRYLQHHLVVGDDHEHHDRGAIIAGDATDLLHVREDIIVAPVLEGEPEEEEDTDTGSGVAAASGSGSGSGSLGKKNKQKGASQLKMRRISVSGPAAPGSGAAGSDQRQ